MDENEPIETPLRRLRLARSLTQRQVADAAGLDQGQYSRIERGQERCSPRTAEAIVGVFGRDFITELHVLYPERYPATMNGQQQTAWDGTTDRRQMS